MVKDEGYRFLIPVPASVKNRSYKVANKALKLDDEKYEIFWDDILTAMENRLKVLSK